MTPGIILTSAVLAALEGAAAKEGAELEERLLVDVAEVALEFVEGRTAGQVRADLDQPSQVLLEALTALARYHLVPGEHLPRREPDARYLQSFQGHLASNNPRAIAFADVAGGAGAQQR